MPDDQMAESPETTARADQADSGPRQRGFSMGTFGLVHGGGFGAWCWERLIPKLEARGHATVTVDLTLEDQAAGAMRCAEVVAQAFATIDDLVLVGHSIAGLIVPLVAAQRPVKRMVFLHALLPRPGHSVVDQLKAEPDMFNPEMLTTQVPFWEDEAVATRFLLHDCPPEIARDAFIRLRPEPGVLGSEVTPLSVWPEAPCSYIVCTDDRTATPAWARRAALKRLGVKPIEIPGGHCPFLARPGHLAEVLHRSLRGPRRTIDEGRALE
jgi:pimeloyl-ACP methyl ester carboxylesterase